VRPRLLQFPRSSLPNRIAAAAFGLTAGESNISSPAVGTTAPDSVTRLVDRFDQNRDAIDSSQLAAYSLRPSDSGPSAVSRKPMACSARGWDVENRQGSAMPYRDVIFEDSLKVGGATKAPDFRNDADGRQLTANGLGEG